MADEKKPDQVVWTKELGYHARSLEYPSNLGAPVIRPDDVPLWKRDKVAAVNSQMGARWAEILEEANRLRAEFEWNEFIYTSVKYSFVPTVGHTYHVYERGTEAFMSMIEPHQWRETWIGSTRLESTGIWVKLDR